MMGDKEKSREVKETSAREIARIWKDGHGVHMHTAFECVLLLYPSLMKLSGKKKLNNQLDFYSQS